MSGSKHTPAGEVLAKFRNGVLKRLGPWRFEESVYDSDYEIWSERNDLIASDVDLENARLIAAAPEMFELLKELGGRNHIIRAHSVAIDALIARIEGREG